MWQVNVKVIPISDSYRENYERVFGKTVEIDPADAPELTRAVNEARIHSLKKRHPFLAQERQHG